jgi:hypothetical protein
MTEGAQSSRQDVPIAQGLSSGPNLNFGLVNSTDIGCGRNYNESQKIRAGMRPAASVCLA